MRHREVLIIDDDETTRHLLESMLSRSGLTVLCATDGDDALDLLNLHDVDVILLDLMMPRCDGGAFLERLTAQRPALVSRVIICSATGSRSFAIGAHHIWAELEKPLQMNQLTDTILNCIAAETQTVTARPALHPFF
ncbi:MAG TPA: response regulator [Thermoanaerobaculia bacterium]